MNFKLFLESQNTLAYHQTGEQGIKGIIQNGQFNLGQGNYGEAVYMTLSPPKPQHNHGGYVISANVNLEGFDLDADPSNHVGNKSNVPGFSFDNYDTRNKWLVVFDNSRLQPYQFSKQPYNQWLPATMEGLNQAGIGIDQRDARGPYYQSPEFKKHVSRTNEKIKQREEARKAKEWEEYLRLQSIRNSQFQR